MVKNDLDSLLTRLNVLAASELVNTNELLSLSLELDNFIYDYMMQKNSSD